MTPEPNQPDPVPIPGRLDTPPEWDDPPPFTAEELRDIRANGVTLDEIIRVIEAEGP